jgi:tetratricopeptide (TPR) repeat protein
MSKSVSVLLSGVMFCSALVAVSQTPSPRIAQLYEKARAEQSSGADAAAVADYLEILRLDPKLGAAYNNLGRLYYNLARYADAVQVLTKGLRIDASMHPAEAMLGASYYQMGEYEKAAPVLELAVRAMPEDPFPRVMLARALIHLDQPEKAMSQLHLLVSKDPKDQEAWYLLGKLQLELSQKAFAHVFAIDPNAPLAHELSGEIMESMSNTAGAITEYKKALAAAPTDSMALEHLANAYWRTGDWAAARDGFLALLRQDPTSCIAHWKLANALDELAESAPDALAHTDAALKTCPSLGQARVERGRLLLRMGRASDALAELLTAEKSAPEEASIQILLAKTYKALGDSAHAAAANARFQQLQQAEHKAEEAHAADVIRANP